MLIAHCSFNCHGGKALPAIEIVGANLVCASCQETVVASAVVFENHNVDNFGFASRWYNRITNEVTHDCSEQVINQMMTEIESLTGVISC